MASWADFTAEHPEIAAIGRRILSKYGVAYLATVRADGAPRVHPISPVVRDGMLLVGIIGSSPKRRDLDRDGRFVLHGLPGPENAELCIRGVVRQFAVDEAAALLALREERGDEATDTVFYELVMSRVDYTSYEAGTGLRPVPTRIVWRAQEVMA
ncbi:hypothetical protein [Lentzea sp. NPDC055074]